LLTIKFFEQYSEDKGKCIVNWKQVTNDEFNHFRCYSFDHVAEKLMAHPSFKNDSVPVQTEAPAKSVQAGIDLKPSSASSCCVKEAESNAVMPSITGIFKQALSKSHVHHVLPVEQQEVFHDFLLKIDKGTFGIPCGDKVCHASLGMNHVSFSGEFYFLPRTLAQLACQGFKKEPSDSFAAVLSPQYPIASHTLQQLKFGRINGDNVSFWTSCDSGSLPVFPKSLV